TGLNLRAKGSATMTLTGTVDPAATGTITNTVKVATVGLVGDSNPNNNSATDTDTLTPIADLSINKTDFVTTIRSGGTVGYTITVTNTGPSDVTGATVSDLFPPEIISAIWTSTATGGATGNTPSSSGDINDTVNMPVGSVITYTVLATISSSATGTLS